MSDETRPKVVDLSTERMRRDYEAGERAHEAGEAFAFEAYTHDPEASVGLIGGDRPIVVMTCPHELRGIAMTREDARTLGRELIDAADAPMLEDDHG